jgi:hypothetical protein
MSRKNGQTEFAVCVDNKGYLAALELRKIYQVLPDQKAAQHKLMRIIDESGEDYLYPERFFITIQLPRAAEEVFLNAA